MPTKPYTTLSTAYLLCLLAYFTLASTFLQHNPHRIYRRAPLAEPEPANSDDPDLIDFLDHHDFFPHPNPEFNTLDLDLDLADLLHPRSPFAHPSFAHPSLLDRFGTPSGGGHEEKEDEHLTGCCTTGPVINGKQTLNCRGNPAWGSQTVTGPVAGKCKGKKVGDKCDAGPPGRKLNVGGGETCAILLGL